MKLWSRLVVSFFCLLTIPSALVTAQLHAGDLAFSDPGKVAKPPAWAVGQADRRPALDVWPGFIRPPAGFGEVPFYWWLGDPLTKERLTWQLDQLQQCKGISGLQINYAHSDRGGMSWGLTYPSEPALFSNEWWQLQGWLMQEVKKRGMGSVSLSDYTLGLGQGWYMDEILHDHPNACGSTIAFSDGPKAEGGKQLKWRVPANLISLTALRLDGNQVRPNSALDLRPFVKAGELAWMAPEGQWQIKVTRRNVQPKSLDPLQPQAGQRYIEEFFQRFEDRNPGEGGKGLNFFFSDELNLQVGGNLWTDGFAREFQRRKGYDVVPELPALAMDIGPRTPKVRLDYHDVMVALSEERFFKPIFDWHQQRGMIYGCDHGGRGTDVIEFGDYFRTQRWNQGPGSDQPRLQRDVIKAKVASSMAHLYLRPRVWLEGFYASGWGTTTSQLADATLSNFVAGYNLLSLHGLYYTTHGGYWEWAPPCNHFRMPYWPHMDRFMACVQRLSYLLSQGYHCCDVAVIYPVAPMEAGMAGQEAVQTAFGTGTHLYARSIDFDFMDFESLARAKVANKQLQVSGEQYRVLVLPAMKALRYSTLQKAAEFFQAGGIVIAAGSLPEASDRAGRNDEKLDALVKSVFGVTAKEAGVLTNVRERRNAAGGLAIVARNPGQVEAAIRQAVPADFASTGSQPRIQHRKIGPRDIYAVYGGVKGSECSFRATGKVELWDPWAGTSTPLKVVSQDAQGTRLKLPLTDKEIQLVVFSPGRPVIDAASEPAPQVVNLTGDWEFDLQPTMDNRWGDFRWPPFPRLIGAEARQLKYREESAAAANPAWYDTTLDDSQWPKVTSSFGQKFWQLGPLPETADVAALDAQLAALQQIDPAVPVMLDGKPYNWRPYDFSWRFGIEHDPGRQGYHGLKELVSDAFIGLKKEAGSRHYLWTSVVSPHDAEARVLTGGMPLAVMWLNHARMDKVPPQVKLREGKNPLLLRYDVAGRGYVVFDEAKEGSSEAAEPNTKDLPDTSIKPLAMSWYNKPGVLAFDARAGEARPAGWYRFTSPPGLKSMTVTARGELRAWVAGKECKCLPVEGSGSTAQVRQVVVEQPAAGPVSVALRIEQDRGCYGGAALPEPVALTCGTGRVQLGSWSDVDGLASYSGGAWYRKTFAVTAGQVKQRVTLNLGDLSSSAEVRINGKLAGVRIAAPWKLDISEWLRPGDNQLEVLVYNTLANHYSTIPTSYGGGEKSGLFGPVSLEIHNAKP